MAKKHGLSDFDSAEERASMHGRVRPRTLQAEHVRRAELEIAEKDRYSWVADIHARIRTATDLAVKGAGNPDMAAYAQSLGILKDYSSERHHAPKLSKPLSRGHDASAQRDNTAEHTSEHHREHQHDDGRESQR